MSQAPDNRVAQQAATKNRKRQLHRGSILHFLNDPNCGENYEYFDDGALVIEEGYVAAVGEAKDLLLRFGTGTEVIEHPRALILPGFIDAHVHYPQLDIIGAYGTQLLEWLERYVFPAEAQFSDITHARSVAERFLRELLRNGTTTALVFGTVHPESVEAFFEASETLNLRMIAGKVMMDRNAPKYLLDTAESSYRDSKALIEHWHGRGRARYALTPRFAPTSTPEQLAAAGRLLKEYPSVYLHTHLSESMDEIALTKMLFPHIDHYLQCYDEVKLLGRRSVFAHCIHLSDEEWRRLAKTQSSVAFCPTSNLFLGSGLFPLRKAEQFGVSVGLGTDIGAGTSLSLLQTIDEAYKVQQLQGDCLSPLKSFYLATLGGARTLDLEPQLGNFLPGKEADFVILDLSAPPLLAHRLSLCKTISEILFALSTLGDDRSVRETWIFGQRQHLRAPSALFARRLPY